MDNSELTRLLDKYSRGECTEDEQSAIEHWFSELDNNPDDTRLHDAQEASELAKKMLLGIKARVNLYEKAPVPFKFAALLKLAAAILVIGVAGLALLYFKSDNTRQSVEVLAADRNPEIFVENNSTTAQHYTLSDGTVVVLQPKGGLTYPREFEKDTRRVQFTGEAFFDVAKDSSRPFIIKTNSITVRVLGTSFNVKSYDGAKEAVVAVKTGKVSVMRPQLHSDGKDEVILTPNQEVVYNTLNENFQKKVVATPLIILAKPTLFEMKYDETPVDKIFEVLEDNYGIDIVFDSKVLSSCTLTTSMAEEGFYERIEIICQAIGAHYEMRDGAIVINSSGCQ